MTTDRTDPTAPGSLPVEPELPPPSVAQGSLAAVDYAEPDVATAAFQKPPYKRLFLISFFILFFELACIRWFGSTVVFLTFFTNIVLIACFLGMSVGCMIARRQTNFIRSVLPLTAIACILSAGLLWAYNEYPDQLMIDVGKQENPAAIYFGTEYRSRDLAKVVLPMPVIGGVFFTLVTLMFIGLGQEMGRAFDAIPSRVKAYSVDVLGSLLGIALFSAMSFAWTSPLVWFAIAALLMLYFVPRWSPIQSISLAAVLIVAGYTSYSGGIGTSITWSPYYKVAYDGRSRGIDTNNIGHQNMVDFDSNTSIYPLPHVLNRDAGNPPFENVMIIGAGSGNDVNAAILGGAKRIDAVEIDPVIQSIGHNHHPNLPYRTREYFYDSPEGQKHTLFRVHINDGRQFLKQQAQKIARKQPVDVGKQQYQQFEEPYDLVSYALVDSLVLHSSYSSIRLESFLFTKEAFEDVYANLKPGGMFVMYNFYRQPWVIGRLNALAKKVFGVEPIVFSLPQQDVIGDQTQGLSAFTFLLVGKPDKDGQNHRLETIRNKLKENDYWLPTSQVLADSMNGYAKEKPTPPTSQPAQALAAQTAVFHHVKPARMEVTVNEKELPTDDWPQLYMRDRKLPPETVQSMIVIGALSLLILIVFMPKGRGAGLPSGRMFFLGAGFMLLETKGVVHMSLLFGSTWITNSVVFFAILVMILLSNLFVLAIKPQKLWPYYLLLLIALAANVAVPMSTYLAIPGGGRIVVSCAVVFVPVFFAGVIFASSFSHSQRPDVDFGWNIAGVILGALAENLAVMIGFNYLIVVAAAFYLLSMPFARRPIAAAPLPDPVAVAA